MKKILATITVLFVAASIFAATAVVPYAAFDVRQKPSDIYVVKLGTCNSGALDTFAIGGAKVYGPYPLSHDPSRPMFKGFRVSANLASLDSGDSLSLSYQLLSGNQITDTIATWTISDTLIQGKRGGYVDISGSAGQSVVFRLLNIDATAALLQAPVRVVLKSSSAEVVDSKR